MGYIFIFCLTSNNSTILQPNVWQFEGALRIETKQILAKALFWLWTNINNVYMVITAMPVVKARVQLLYVIDILVVNAL